MQRGQGIRRRGGWPVIDAVRLEPVDDEQVRIEVAKRQSPTESGRHAPDINLWRVRLGSERACKLGQEWLT